MSDRVGERCTGLKKDGEIVDDITVSQEKLCFREKKKKDTFVQETNKSIMQKYMTNFMDPIHWQLDHCSSN